MKRKFLVVLLVVLATLCMAFGLSACGEKETDKTGNNPPVVDPSGGTQKPEEGEQGGTQKPDEGEQNEPHVHSFINYIYNDDATCTEDGTETATCFCGETDSRTKEGTALGHAMQTIEAQEPTCTQNGWDAYQQCSRCQEKENYIEKPSLGHDYRQLPAKSPTCSEAGYLSHTECSRCHDLMGAKVTYTPALHVQYKLIGNYSVTGLSKDCQHKVINLPETYMGKPVTSIGDYAFLGCSGLTSIVISDSVTTIGENAFDGCSELTSVTIGRGVISIGERAFFDCGRLEKIIWNAENCTKAGSYSHLFYSVFQGCENLSCVNFGENVKTIPAYAFANCSELTSIVIPDSVTEIGEYAFYCCFKMASVSIGRGVTELKKLLFCHCERLTSVNLIYGQ